MIPATVPDTSLIAPGVTPKWPPPGAWIHFNQSPPIISEGQTKRNADPDEAIIAAVLSYKWRQLMSNYRLRLPLDMDEFAAYEGKAEIPFRPATCNGHCNGDFLPHGTKMIVDFGAEAVPGDIVLVQFDEQTQAMLDYFGEKYAPQYYRETYGHVRGGGTLKLYMLIDGRDILMNAGQALLMPSATKILAVARNVQINDVPVYGSLLKITTQETHQISRYQPEVKNDE